MSENRTNPYINPYLISRQGGGAVVPGRPRWPWEGFGKGLEAWKTIGSELGKAVEEPKVLPERPVPFVPRTEGSYLMPWLNPEPIKKTAEVLTQQPGPELMQPLGIIGKVPRKPPNLPTSIGKSIAEKDPFEFMPGTRSWKLGKDIVHEDINDIFDLMAGAEKKLRAGETLSLAEALNSPKLFERWPRLKDAKVSAERGTSRAGEGEIVLNLGKGVSGGGVEEIKDWNRTLRQKLRHEVSHLVAEEAGMELGATPAQAQNILSENYTRKVSDAGLAAMNEHPKEMQMLLDAARRDLLIERDPINASALKQAIDELDFSRLSKKPYENLSQAESDLKLLGSEDKYGRRKLERNWYSDLVNEQNKIKDQYQSELNVKYAPFGRINKKEIEQRDMSIYGRTQGEALARTEAIRVEMTPAERAAEPPWVTLRKVLEQEGASPEKLLTKKNPGVPARTPPDLPTEIDIQKGLRTPKALAFWDNIYSQAKPLTGSQISYVGGGKIEGVPVMTLEIGCQRVNWLDLASSQKIVSKDALNRACFNDCWTNDPFRVRQGIQGGRIEPMQEKGIRMATPKAIEDFWNNKKNVDWVNSFDFIRHGQKGDDSHLFKTGIAKEWLAQQKAHGVTKKNVFISASYAPNNPEDYAALLPYKNQFVIHFSNSGWFEPGEIVNRLNQFRMAKDAGLDVRIRLITNRSGVANPLGDVPNMANEQKLIQIIHDNKWDKYVLETPYHNDVSKKRSVKTGEFKNVCCETGSCATCKDKCMIKPISEAGETK